MSDRVRPTGPNTPPAGNTSSPKSNPEIPETQWATDISGPQLAVTQTEAGTTVADVVKDPVTSGPQIPAAGSMASAPPGVVKGVPVTGPLSPTLFVDIEPGLLGRLYPNAGMSGAIRDMALAQGEATARAGAALMAAQQEPGALDESGNPTMASGLAGPRPNDPGTRPPYGAPNPTVRPGAENTMPRVGSTPDPNIAKVSTGPGPDTISVTRVEDVPQDTYTDGGGSQPPTAPPVNRDVPYVSQQGQTLNCTMGNWDGEPTSYSYAWKVNNNAAGSDAATYNVQPGDVGGTATCTVTATNALGSTAAPPSNSVTIS